MSTATENSIPTWSEVKNTINIYTVNNEPMYLIQSTIGFVDIATVLSDKTTYKQEIAALDLSRTLYDIWVIIKLQVSVQYGTYGDYDSRLWNNYYWIQQKFEIHNEKTVTPTLLNGIWVNSNNVFYYPYTNPLMDLKMYYDNTIRNDSCMVFELVPYDYSINNEVNPILSCITQYEVSVYSNHWYIPMSS